MATPPIVRRVGPRELVRRGWCDRRIGPFVCALCALACSVHEPPTAPASPAAPPSHAAADSFAGWLHGPAANALANKASELAQPRLIGGACISHVGCEITGPALPACTATSSLPPGYAEVRGDLSLSTYAFQGGPQSVLQCMGTDRTTLTVKSSSAEYDLGVWCHGDRTSWCCPYPIGTPIRAIGKVGTDHGVTRLLDYWMCSEGAPAPPEPAASTALVVVRLGQPPGKATWASGSTLATWDFERARLFQIHSEAKKPFVCVDLDPTGQRAFTIDQAGDGAVWTLETGALNATLKNFAPGARLQPFAPDVSCTYELADAVSWAKDGGALLVLSASGAAAVYTPGSGSFQSLSSQVALDNFHYEFFAPGGRELLIAATHGELELWQVEPLRKRLLLAGTAGTWSPDGRELLVRLSPGVAEPVTYQLRDTADGSLRWELPGACLAEWSPNGRYIAAQLPCGTPQVALIDAGNGRTLARIPASYRPLWSGRRSAPPQYAPHLAQLLERGSLGHSLPIPELSLDPAQNVLAAADGEGVTLWRSTGTRITLKGNVGRSTAGLQFDPALEFSPDGTALAARERFWSLSRSGAAPRSVVLPPDLRSTQLIWSPDSRYLAFWNWVQQNGEERFKTATLLSVVARDSGRALVSEGAVSNAAPNQRVVGLLSPSWVPHTPVLVVPVPGSDQLVALKNVAHGSQLWFTIEADENGPSAVALSADGRFEGRRELAIRIQSEQRELKLPSALREEHGLLEKFMKD